MPAAALCHARCVCQQPASRCTACSALTLPSQFLTPTGGGLQADVWPLLVHARAVLCARPQKVSRCLMQAAAAACSSDAARQRSNWALGVRAACCSPSFQLRVAHCLAFSPAARQSSRWARRSASAMAARSTRSARAPTSCTFWSRPPASRQVGCGRWSARSAGVWPSGCLWLLPSPGGS